MILVLLTLGFSSSLAKFFIILVVLSCICLLVVAREEGNVIREVEIVSFFSVDSIGCRFVVYLLSPSLSNQSPAEQEKEC